MPDARSPKPRSQARLLSLAGAALLLGGLGIATAQEARRGAREARPKRTHELWFFFSPTQKDLSRDVTALAAFLKKHPQIELRPCLLIDRWSAIEHPSEEFAKTLKELRSLRTLEGAGPFSLRVWDDEGVAFAGQLGIERLPAYALLATPSKSGARRAHLAVGREPRLEELISCP